MFKSYILKDRVHPVVIGELQTVVDYNVTPEQVQRRARMIEFLENECPVEAFVFAVALVPIDSPTELNYWSAVAGRKLKSHCGTVGCAIGHAYRLFDVEHHGHYSWEAMRLFGMGPVEAFDAFSPGEETDLPYAGPDATPQQVATRLRAAFARHPAP